MKEAVNGKEPLLFTNLTTHPNQECLDSVRVVNENANWLVSFSANAENMQFSEEMFHAFTIVNMKPSAGNEFKLKNEGFKDGELRANFELLRRSLLATFS
mmetsp:Transcript_22614/g.21781  ORF Transcript_22614/g.21781 Transcript_22614/m.21781 type:complete len:100 (+) Transcript_22614:206-505(+)